MDTFPHGVHDAHLQRGNPHLTADADDETIAERADLILRTPSEVIDLLAELADNSNPQRVPLTNGLFVPGECAGPQLLAALLDPRYGVAALGEQPRAVCLSEGLCFTHPKRSDRGTGMGYWQTLLLMFPLGVFGFRAGAWTYWRMWRMRRGELAPGWGEAFSAAWYSTSGAAIAMIFYRPGA